MYKRLVDDFVNNEIKKGVPLKKIRKYLLKNGYALSDVDEILRNYEIREEEISRESSQLQNSAGLLKVLAVLLIILIIGNFVFFYYFAVKPVTSESSPTGFSIIDEDYLQQTCEKYIKEGKINITTLEDIKR